MKDINVEELKSRSDAGDALNVIDVREPHEYAEANIDAILLPLGEVLTGDLSRIPFGKDEEIIFQCRSGRRSADAALYLESRGFTNCKNLVGGILAWQEKFGAEKLK